VNDSWKFNGVKENRVKGPPPPINAVNILMQCFKNALTSIRASGRVSISVIY